MLTKVSRRHMLKLFAVATGGTLAACAPKIVKETVVVEKEVEKVVQQTVVVEKEKVSRRKRSSRRRSSSTPRLRSRPR